jgi:asparagine synthase (glutamine-hydrolysing)
MQHFNQYYFSKEDQHMARQTQPDFANVEQAVMAIGDCFRNNIGQAVRQIRTKDKRIGVLLSGGVDSSLLLAMLRQHTDADIVCFTALAENDDPDVLPSKEIAHAFKAKWVKCRIKKHDLPEQLPPLLKLSYGGLYDTAGNLALDSCMRYCQAEGITNLWTGNGLDMMFGGGVDPTRFDDKDQETFHNQFWDFVFDLLTNRFYKQTGDEIDTLASRYGVKIIMPFENLDSIICARRISANMLFQKDEDKYPVRVLAHRYGVPLHLARRQKDPLQHSSGMFDVLREYMYDTLPKIVHDAVNFKLTPSYFASNPDTDLQVFLTLLAEQSKRGNQAS